MLLAVLMRQAAIWQKLLFQIYQSEESIKITINAHIISCSLHQLPITTAFTLLCRHHGVCIQVRGLCPDSMFNTAYTLTMAGAGWPRYLGRYTSSIQFDGDTQLWHWRDMRLGASVATRAVSRRFHVTI